MQPLQYDLRCPAAKDNNVMHAAAPSNLDAAITMRSAPPMAHPHVSTHMATEHCNIHAAIALRSATADCKRPYNCAQANSRTVQNTL